MGLGKGLREKGLEQGMVDYKKASGGRLEKPPDNR